MHNDADRHDLQMVNSEGAIEPTPKSPLKNDQDEGEEDTYCAT